MIINDFMTLLREHKVVIPPIQRDYAQGRMNDDVKRIRDRFLKKITSVLVDDYVGKPLKLDFIYGYTIVDETGNGTPLSLFLPLDGQQRLTTLFLIYWYAAISEGKMDKECQTVLANFSYSTRAKSRKFCNKLVEFSPSGDNNTIASQIRNQPWFFISWASDPTISSMLVMLDAIQKEFSASNLNGVWEKLTGPKPRIIFYLLKMEDLGLPEDLYIKMNSRGKALTEFEYFKSQFSGLIPSDLLPQFKAKIDNDWSDLFWNMHKNSKANDVAREVDSSFLSFYNYITDILISTKDIPVEKTYWLDVAASVYKENTENVEFLFKCLDLFVEQEKSKPDYFSSLFYIEESEYTSEKVRLFFSNPQTNLFYKCAKAYDLDKRPNPFSIGEQLLLFASILNLLGIVNNP